jgi:hypothetical protein
MPRYNLLFAVVMITGLVFISVANSQYWFQSGVRGSNDTAFNNGGSVSVETIYQNATEGSIGFWLGESLSNGAFIQVGYEVPNATGYYSTSCTNSSTNVFLKTGMPTWFWEYFMPGANESSFCGGIGPNGSAGLNGSYNTYSFAAAPGTNVWSVYFNDQRIGKVNLGTDNSGPNPISAFAEYAQTNSNMWPMSTVKFKNLAYFTGNLSRLVPEGYSSISYGKGSYTILPNPYGVREVANFSDYFEVGSNIQAQLSSVVLWRVGYSLNIYSDYSNLTSNANYIAYSVVPLSAPRIINLNRGARELFTGWVGSGSEAYTGNQTSQYVTIYGNITETATWKREYYLNATTQFGGVVGSGWYDANSTPTVYLAANIVAIAPGKREVFTGWSDGEPTNETTLIMDGPRNVSALWKTQYYLNVASPYGNASGGGWYDANSVADISLSGLTVPINQTSRYAFYNWSNGNVLNRTAILVNSPIIVNANFEKQYLVSFEPEDSNGDEIGPIGYYNVSSKIVNGSTFFAFANKRYNIEYIYYKGVPLTTNYHFGVDAPTNLQFKTPVYDIAIQTMSVFGTPVNARINLTFKNNTKLDFISNSTGLNKFYDVPYGYASGYADYLGFRESIDISNGSGSYLTFLTNSLVFYIIGGILFIAAVAWITVYYERRKSAKSRN